MALGFIQLCQVVHGSDGIGMLFAEYFFTKLQDIYKEPFCLSASALVLMQKCQVVHEDDVIRMLFAE